MNGFLPLSYDEMKSRGWNTPDFVYVTGDAYVDHPSFGVAIISRMLEDKGYTVAILAQPDWRKKDDFKKFGKPRLGFLVTSGNIDSMVAHYTVSKKRRNYDYYSPSGKSGLRPDRACIVYCNLIRQCYGDIPIIIGGLEASLRRFAHYDYWSESVRRSILIDSKADILSYGMGERSIERIAELLNRNIPVKKIRDIKGTCVVCKLEDLTKKEENDYIICGDYNKLKEDKKVYADAFKVQYNETDYINGKTVIEIYDDKILKQNPPSEPLSREELDKIYELNYERDYHPFYKKTGGIPAIEEVKFSVTHNRGCFGACNFCALTFHQGRSVRSRSVESVLREIKLITELPDFKGYIHDIGGPTANFRYPSCDKQLEHGTCKDRKCLAPSPCKHLKIDHSEYKNLIEDAEKIPKVKKIFIRSGIRFDYLMLDKDKSFFKKIVRDNISGQLKVAPEHISEDVLKAMGKSPVSIYNRFCDEYYALCDEYGKEQYLVPYLMSSHPGSTLKHAIELAVYLKKNRIAPEQVQDFYPTPGTVSTCMYYTGINPLTGKKIYTPTDYREKKMQRALLQPSKPGNRELVLDALRIEGRQDLAGILIARGKK